MKIKIEYYLKFQKDRSFIEDNLSYKDNTAGRLMQKEVVKVLYSFDVGDTIDYLRKSKSLPSVFMIFFWLIKMTDLLVWFHYALLFQILEAKKFPQ